MHSKWPLVKIDSIKSPTKYSCVGGPFGSSLSRKHYVEVPCVPVLRGVNLSGDQFNDCDFVYVSENKAKELHRNMAYPNDVVFTQRGTLGQVAIIPENAQFSEYVVSQSQMKLTVNSDIAEPYFIYSYFRTPQAKKQIDTHAIVGGVPHINLGILKELEIPLPPLAIQKQISTLVRSIDNKIELNTQTNQTLEQMAQAIFKSWFVDFDPVKAKMNGEQPEGMDAPFLSKEVASLFPEKLVESELGLIPEGWDIEPLKNVSRVINGRAYKNTEFKEEGTPIIRIQNLTGKGKTVYSDLDLPKDKLVEHGDLIFAWSATFGPYLWRGPKSIYHYHIWKMDVNENKFGKYLLYLHLARLTDYLKNQGTGSIFTHLTKAIMDSQKLVVPSEPIVEAFSKLVTPLFAQIDSLHTENQVLKQLRDTLLPKLLSGEIELDTTINN